MVRGFLGRILCVALMASCCCSFAAAAEASGTIPPSGVVKGGPALVGARTGTSAGRRLLPLRVRSPASYAQVKRAAAARAAAQRAHQGAAGAALATPPVSIFAPLNAAGISAAEQRNTTGCGTNDAAATCVDTTPPDTTGAIGPANYVEFVNARVAVYDRSLSPVGSSVDLTTFVGGVDACDPQVKYDTHTSRWFYVAIRCDGTTTTNQLYLGFSKTSSPTPLSSAGWCRYTYSFGVNFPDYPKLALDGTHIMLGDNLFSASNSFLTSQIIGLQEPAAGSISSCPSAPSGLTFGSAGSPLMTAVAGNQAFTPEPAMVADGSAGGYIVSADQNSSTGNGSNVMVWQMTGSGASPTLSALGAPAVPAFSPPANIPQPSTTDQIDSMDGRLTSAIAAVDPSAGREAVWTEHTVDSGAGGSLVRWYEIVPGSTPTARQVGTVTDAGGWTFNGAIAPTTSGGAVINYNTGGPSQNVSVAVRARLASAPLGAMNTPIAVGSSSTTDKDFSCPSQPFGLTHGSTSCRWGDYAGASVDPTNCSTVWGSNQVNGPDGANVLLFGNQSQWATQNFAVSVAGSPPTAGFAAGSGHPVTGLPLAFNGSTSAHPDAPISAYSWNFGDGSTGSGVSPVHTYKKKGTYAVKLTVADCTGQRSSTTRSIKVVAAKITKITKKKNNKKRSVVVEVKVNAPGVIHVGKKKKRLKKPGTAKFTIKLSGKQKAALAQKGTLTIKVKVRFVPDAGGASKRTVKVTFRQ